MNKFYRNTFIFIIFIPTYTILRYLKNITILLGNALLKILNIAIFWQYL